MAWWKKPSGLKVETNDMDATVEHCEALGWKRIKEREPQAEEPQIAEPAAVAESAAEEPRRRRVPAG